MLKYFYPTPPPRVCQTEPKRAAPFVSITQRDETTEFLTANEVIVIFQKEVVCAIRMRAAGICICTYSFGGNMTVMEMDCGGSLAIAGFHHGRAS